MCLLERSGTIVVITFSLFGFRSNSEFFFDTGLSTEIDEIKTNIVLAGDPMQLEPVTKSQYAIKLGFKTSFMEYLFEKPCYKRRLNEDNGRIYTVQLTKNYRTHSDILSIPNDLFYKNSLENKPTGIKVLTIPFFFKYPVYFLYI